MRKKVLRKLSFGCACFGIMFLSLFPVHAEAEDTYMKSILTELTTSPRAIGTPEIDKALEYLEAELASMEYDIEKQTFYYDEELNASSVQNRGNLSGYLSGAFTNSSEGIPGINLIAEKKSPDVKKTLILSAHYDTCTGSIGANDNGSGISVLLNIAKQYSQQELPFNLRFILFSGEESWFLGSRYYVSTLSDLECKDIIGVINIDSVAEESNLDYWLLVAEGEEVNTPDGIVDFKPADNLMSLQFASDSKFTLVCQMNSDHYPFSLLDIPAVTITQDLSEELHINSENDKLEYIDYARLIEISDCVNNAIRTLGENL